MLEVGRLKEVRFVLDCCCVHWLVERFWNKVGFCEVVSLLYGW